MEYNDEYWKDFYQLYKDQTKRWVEENKEKYVEYHKKHSKEYYEKNKENVVCECGWEGMKYSLKQHKRLHKRHKEWEDKRLS